MLSIPVLEPGFRKAVLIVSAGHGLLFALIWFASPAHDAPPRPMTVRLQLAAEQPVMQKPTSTPPKAVRPVLPAKELPAPEVSVAPTPIAKSPAPAPAAIVPMPVSATPTPVATNTSAVSPIVAPTPTPTPTLPPAGAPVPAVAQKSIPIESIPASSPRSAQPSAASAPPAVLGGAEDRQPTVDASFRGNRIPEYPAMSRRLGEQGVVILRVLITPDGQASEVLLVKSSGSSRLDRSAMDSIREWRFVPALKGGRPVSAWYEWRWEFRLSG